jgi:hypothetical protein
MTPRPIYAPILPQFDAFLFASVGEEVNGMPLSVLSALSRLDLDPRDEAVRLAHLTKEAAADQLARMIARLSDRRWSVAEARGIAGGLIERLPMASTAGTPDRTAPRALLTARFGALPWFYPALALALLVGVIAGGYLSFGG